MQPVNFFTQVDHTLGAIGYSILRLDYDGASVEPWTMLFLRDSDGILRNTVIAPASQLREVIF